MTFGRCCLGFALPLALVCAGCGPSNHGQPATDALPPAATAPTTPTPAPMDNHPMGANPISAGSTGAQAMRANPAMQGTAGQYAQPSSNATTGMAGGQAAFNSMAGASGHITRSDAMHDPWLKDHFQECDTNDDGNVSRAEYAVCRGANAAMPSSASSSQHP